MKARILSGCQRGPIEFMTSIEKTYVKMGKLQAQTNSYFVKNNIYGPMTTSLVNRQFGLIHRLNLVRSKVQEVPLGYEAWEFFQHPNHELNNAQIMVGHFTAAVVTNHMFDASQRLSEA